MKRRLSEEEKISMLRKQADANHLLRAVIKKQEDDKQRQLLEERKVEEESKLKRQQEKLLELTSKWENVGATNKDDAAEHDMDQPYSEVAESNENSVTENHKKRKVSEIHNELDEDDIADGEILS